MLCCLTTVLLVWRTMPSATAESLHWQKRCPITICWLKYSECISAWEGHDVINVSVTIQINVTELINYFCCRVADLPSVFLCV